MLRFYFPKNLCSMDSYLQSNYPSTPLSSEKYIKFYPFSLKPVVVGFVLFAFFIFF